MKTSLSKIKDARVTVNESKSRLTVKGLAAGKQYTFRVSAVGAKGQGPWSDEITRFVA